MQAGSSFIEFSLFWTEFKSICSTKRLAIQYEEATFSDTDLPIYSIIAMDGVYLYRCTIFKTTVPDGIATDYSQGTNDTDKSNFETNYKPYANLPIGAIGSFNDPRIIHRFGNLTATSQSEVLVSSRAYNVQGSEAQRSVKSTSATDDDTPGSGARVVRLTYLTSNYVLKTEDIALNGTAAVATQASDIRFVERFEVIKGTVAVGAIELWSNNSGGGTAICGIAAATDQAYLCHHYIPAGMRAWVLNWGVTVDDEANVKLLGQDQFGVNLVDRVLDLQKLTGTPAAAAGMVEFNRSLNGVYLPEKTYVRVTVAPLQVASTVIRSRLDLWEIPA